MKGSITVNNKKRFTLAIALVLAIASLVSLPAMAAERTTLDITSPLIGADQVNMAPVGSDVTFVAAAPNTAGVMYTFWVGGPNGWDLKQDTASNEYTLENVQPGTYTVDVYIRSATKPALAEARQVILVDSNVTFTESIHKDGKFTLTAQAVNFSGEPEYQFWYKDSEGWKCPKEPVNLDYNTRNTVSFEATAGQTYEVAVYAKDKNADGSWKQAAAAGKIIRASEQVDASEGNNGDVLNLKVGQALKLSLGENPSTGFSWEYKSMFDTNVLEEEISLLQYSDVPEGWVGAPGVRSWIYRALQAGSTTIDLWYIQPWSPAPVPADTFILQVNVAP